MANSMDADLKTLTDKQFETLMARYDNVFDIYDVKKGTNRRDKEAAFLKLMDTVKSPDVKEDIEKSVATALEDAKSETKDNLKALSDKDLDALSARYDAVFEKYEVKKGTNRQEKEEAFLKLMDAVPPINKREMSEDLAKVSAPPNEPAKKLDILPPKAPVVLPTAEEMRKSLEKEKKDQELKYGDKKEEEPSKKGEPQLPPKKTFIAPTAEEMRKAMERMKEEQVLKYGDKKPGAPGDLEAPKRREFLDIEIPNKIPGIGSKEPDKSEDKSGGKKSGGRGM